MCYLCQASIGNLALRYTDASRTAGWRATQKTTASYSDELALQGKTLPVLLSSLVGLDLRMVMIDVLHTVDQGVTSHVAANIFWSV